MHACCFQAHFVSTFAVYGDWRLETDWLLCPGFLVADRAELLRTALRSHQELNVVPSAQEQGAAATG